MRAINTSQEGWQKQMEKAMSLGERFTLITLDKNLAAGLVSGAFNAGVIKLILFGSGAAACGVGGAGAAVVGVSGAALVGAGAALLALSDPEPISKAVLASNCRHMPSTWRIFRLQASEDAGY